MQLLLTTSIAPAGHKRKIGYRDYPINPNAMANLVDFAYFADLPLEVIGKVMSHLTSTTTVTDGVSRTRDDRSAFRQASRAS